MAIEIEQSIVDSLKNLIEREAYRRSTPSRVFEDRYDYLTSTLKYEAERAQQFYDDIKDGGLTANTIESEGFLRAMRMIEAIVEDANEINNAEDL